MKYTESTYKYRPLTEPGAIRLIELPPSEDPDTRLECNLIHTTFDEMNDEVVYHYCALSYASPLYLGRCDLYQQKDDKEKAVQVSQMGEVYKAARHTVIWLGDGIEDDGAEHMLASIRDVKKKSQLLATSGSLDISRIWPGELTFQSTGIECLTGLPWFSRVWTYQELILSRDPWLQVRRTRARWTDVSLIVSSYLKKTKGFNEPCKRFLSMDLARKDFHVQIPSERKRPSTVLFETLVSRRGLGVFDARDMIYAHLGIVGESPLDVLPDEGNAPRADYKKDCSELYRNVAHYLSRQIDIFKLLSHVEAASDQRYPETPSWAPNWMIRPLPLKYGRLSDSIALLREQYCSKFRRLEDTLDDSNGSLLLRTLPESYKLWLDKSTISFLGFRMGTITQLATVMAYYDNIEDLLEWSYESSRSSISPPTTPVGQESYSKYTTQKTHSRWWDVFCPLLKDRSEYDQMLERSRARLRGQDLRDAALTNDDILTHVLLHEFRVNDPTYPHFLYGRRLALMPGGGFAVVPSAARVGDVACFFLERTTVPFLLRLMVPTNFDWIDSKIRNTFRPRIPGKFLPVNHFEFIGECLLENYIFSSFDGRYFADLSGEHYPGTLEAFVLH
ncbi:hypothetical protein V8E51_003991 [Hyaloscypha variabilis]